MSDRQYGIPSGYRTNGASPDTGYVSPPINAYNNMQSSHLRYQQQTGPRADPSTARRPVPGFAGDAEAPPPPPPQHRSHDSPVRNGAAGGYPRQSTTSPGADNYGYAAAGGGMGGLATGLADSQPRESGMNALRGIDNLYGGRMLSPSPEPPRQQQPYESYDMSEYTTPQRPPHQHAYSQSSVAPLMANREEHPRSAPSPDRGPHGQAFGAVPGPYNAPPNRRPYQSDGYDDVWDPRDFADDDDDDFPPERSRGKRNKYGAAAAAGGAGAGAAAGAGMFGARDPSGAYGPVGANSGDPEKSAWMQKQSNGSKRWKWIVGLIAAALVIAGVVVGVLFGVVFNDDDSDSSSGSSSSDSSSGSGSSSGLYDKNSKEIKSILNDDDLHRVFPGMDYTPWGAQYPECLHNPLDQNNITIDVAILSQLTPAIRLYGTDCNQTEMVIEGINRLDLADSVKVWLGVWIDDNSTTTDRQVEHAHGLLDKYDPKHWAGVIVGNEVLYAEYMTITELGEHMNDFRSDLSDKDIDLPVSTGDLGDDWTEGLASDSDIVMANIHPFFAGVTSKEAASWTWSFWQNNNVPLTPAAKAAGNYPQQIISEVGWPSEGGNNCGGNKCADSTSGSVAGIDQLNTFMQDWVCPSIANGTTYFWFSAFDEPWKTRFDSEENKVESHWGLLGVDRKLKKGVTIPDCDGETV